MAQGGRSEESRGIAASQHIAQASRLDGGGEVLAGPVRFTRADTTCDETMVARRRQARRGAVWQAWRRQAWRAARWALRLMWRTWAGVVSLMRVPDEGGELTRSCNRTLQ